MENKIETKKKEIKESLKGLTYAEFTTLLRDLRLEIETTIKIE